MLKYDGYQIVFQEVPDEISLVFNITGCPRNCEGCHSPHLREDGGRPLLDDIFDIIEKHQDEISCVCFMGGDHEPVALSKLLLEIRTFHSPLKIALYSGSHNPPDILWRLVHYMKVGPYNERLGGLREKTTNQRMYKIGLSKENITSKFWPKEI